MITFEDINPDLITDKNVLIAYQNAKKIVNQKPISYLGKKALDIFLSKMETKYPQFLEVKTAEIDAEVVVDENIVEKNEIIDTNPVIEAPLADKPIENIVDYIFENFYAKNIRLSKSKIEDLAKQKNIELGNFWEILEQSWGKWYQNIFLSNLSDSEKLQKAIFFWENVQPTYAYSDSNKELYKQYSTPAIISFCIAQWAKPTTQTVFEPSAGNGLFVSAFEPSKVTVNEIDQTRFNNLNKMGFAKVTNKNAALPFEEYKEKFDFVVTNPPFAQWVESENVQNELINTVFDGFAGIHKARLEHLMSAIALQTMKPTGRAVLLIGGFASFDQYGIPIKHKTFFNWLNTNYIVADVFNINSFKLYNKQGTVEPTMLIFIDGKRNQKLWKPFKMLKYENTIIEPIDSFYKLYDAIKKLSENTDFSAKTIIKQLRIELSLTA